MSELNKTEKLLENYPFISALADGRTITEPMRLNPPEIKALSEYFTLDDYKRDMEKLYMYLLGCRHMVRCLEMLKII